MRIDSSCFIIETFSRGRDKLGHSRHLLPSFTIHARTSGEMMPLTMGVIISESILSLTQASVVMFMSDIYEMYK